MIIKVVVPKPATLARDLIKRGSAVVVAPDTTSEAGDSMAPRCVLYYEGNLYGACNLKRYDEKVMVAAGRATQRAPTAALLWTRPDEVIVVGHYDSHTQCLTLLKDEAATTALAEWCPEALEEGA